MKVFRVLGLDGWARGLYVDGLRRRVLHDDLTWCPIHLVLNVNLRWAREAVMGDVDWGSSIGRVFYHDLSRRWSLNAWALKV